MKDIAGIWAGKGRAEIETFSWEIEKKVGPIWLLHWSCGLSSRSIPSPQRSYCKRLGGNGASLTSLPLISGQVSPSEFPETEGCSGGAVTPSERSCNSFMGKLFWHRRDWEVPKERLLCISGVTGTGSQGQEQEACPDKALGMVWMKDAFVVRMGKIEAQRRTGAFLETHTAGPEPRSGYLPYHWSSQREVMFLGWKRVCLQLGSQWFPPSFRDRAFFEPLVIPRTQWQGVVPIELQHTTREHRTNQSHS